MNLRSATGTPVADVTGYVTTSPLTSGTPIAAPSSRPADERDKILPGGTLGRWLWYRWQPAPALLNDPFSTGCRVLVGAPTAIMPIGGVTVMVATRDQAGRAATGSAPVELECTRENSFCCGAGGGRMWLEENEGTRINLNRIQKALAGKPDTLCVSCPYCLTMFADGLKDLQADTVQVRDIAEVVAEGLRPRQ